MHFFSWFGLIENRTGCCLLVVVTSQIHKQTCISGNKTTIRLWITDIDTESGMNGGNEHCKEDVLTVLEGNDETIDNSNVIAEICG